MTQAYITYLGIKDSLLVFGVYLNTVIVAKTTCEMWWIIRGSEKRKHCLIFTVHKTFQMLLKLPRNSNHNIAQKQLYLCLKCYIVECYIWSTVIKSQKRQKEKQYYWVLITHFIIKINMFRECLFTVVWPYNTWESI